MGLDRAMTAPVRPGSLRSTDTGLIELPNDVHEQHIDVNNWVEVQQNLPGWCIRPPEN
jgi:hypothetical protein